MMGHASHGKPTAASDVVDSMTTIADFHAHTLSGEEVDLGEYLGRVVLVVNTASKCGLTPQFEGLQSLYNEFGTEGFVVLGFPCGQFAGQELDSADEIGEFCQVNYGVTFPMFAKVDVNGSTQHPLFRWLKKEKRDPLGKAIKWNFTKFLLGKDGAVIARYAPNHEPAEIADDIRVALAR
jgi:glutathione peroxidase